MTSIGLPVSCKPACRCHSITVRDKDGGWLDSHPVPLDRASTSVADEAARRNKQTLQHLLRTLRSADPADQISLRKMRRLLDSCMDASALDTAGIAPLLEVLRRVKQLCKSELRPASNPSGAIAPQDVTHDYTAVLAYLHSLGI